MWNSLQQAKSMLRIYPQEYILLHRNEHMQDIEEIKDGQTQDQGLRDKRMDIDKRIGKTESESRQRKMKLPT